MWLDNTPPLVTPRFPCWRSAAGRPAHFFFRAREGESAICGVEYRRNLVNPDSAMERPHCKKCTRLIDEGKAA